MKQRLDDATNGLAELARNAGFGSRELLEPGGPTGSKPPETRRDERIAR